MEDKSPESKIFLKKTAAIIGVVIIAVIFGIIGNVITRRNDGFVIEKNKAASSVSTLQNTKSNLPENTNKADSKDSSNVVKPDKININTATKDQLVSLPAIGEKTAQDIIDYRNRHGTFKRCEDIMKVKGIKKGKYNKFKDKITID